MDETVVAAEAVVVVVAIVVAAGTATVTAVAAMATATARVAALAAKTTATAGSTMVVGCHQKVLIGLRGHTQSFGEVNIMVIA